jgi:antitoxin YefM
MSSETTYASLRANLANVLDRVSDDRDVVVIRRKGAKDVALVAAEELSSLMEIAHLLRSPANARRLTAAAPRAAKGNA